MNKALIYTRVSTGIQGEDGSSLDSQVAACEDYVKSINCHTVRTVREVFSGAYLFDRPLLNEVREAAKLKQFDHVVVYAIDRLSRNIAHLMMICEDFERYGVELHFVTEKFDKTSEGKLIQSVKGYVAEVEREKIRERTMRGRRTKANNGTLNYGRKLFGYYLTSDGARRCDPSESDVVRRAYASYLRGGSLRGIAADFNSEGIRTPQGHRTWWAYSVAHILKNPAYCGRTTAFRYKHDIKFVAGVRKHNGSALYDPSMHVILPDITPPIVSQDDWDAVQLILERNKKAKRGNPRSERLLRGMVRCVACGRQFSPVMAKTYPAYVCTSKQNPTTNCGTKMLGALKAESAVWEHIERFIRNPDLLTTIHSESAPVIDNTGLDALAASIERCDAEIDRLVVRAESADDSLWPRFNERLRIKQAELARLNQTRNDMLLARDRPTIRDARPLLERLTSRVDNLTFPERVNVLKALDATVLWDGSNLNVSIYTQYDCKSDIDNLYNTTVI